MNNIEYTSATTFEQRSFHGAVYQVTDPRYTDWYEYRIDEIDEGEVWITFDSLYETYNGVQRLSYDKACVALKEALDLLQAGDPDWLSYFDPR